jgi:hypothetical protein
VLVTGGRCSEVAVYTGFKCVFVKCVMSISVVKKSQRFLIIELYFQMSCHFCIINAFEIKISLLLLILLLSG